MEGGRIDGRELGCYLLRELGSRGREGDGGGGQYRKRKCLNLHFDKR